MVLFSNKLFYSYIVSQPWKNHYKLFNKNKTIFRWKHFYQVGQESYTTFQLLMKIELFYQKRFS